LPFPIGLHLHPSGSSSPSVFFPIGCISIRWYPTFRLFGRQRGVRRTAGHRQWPSGGRFGMISTTGARALSSWRPILECGSESTSRSESAKAAAVHAHAPQSCTCVPALVSWHSSKFGSLCCATPIYSSAARFKAVDT
jgi:hypothetical protein